MKLSYWYAMFGPVLVQDSDWGGEGMVSQARERGEAGVLWQGRVGRQAGAFLAWMCGTPGMLTERLSCPWTLESFHLLPPLYYGSNPSFSCAHHGYSWSLTGREGGG